MSLSDFNHALCFLYVVHFVSWLLHVMGDVVD